MMNDERRQERIRKALDESFSYLKDRPSLQGSIMGKVKGEIRVKRRIPITVAIAMLLMLLVLGVVYAEHQWKVLSEFGFFVGSDVIHADEVMQGDLHKTTVNGVDITVKEAGYDGRTLFLLYSFRLPEEENAFTQENIEDAESRLDEEYNVGWWIDNIWFDGKAMDMPWGSSTETNPGTAPGEIDRAEYWRLDHENVHLFGKVDISLPIGKKQELLPRDEQPELYDENGRRLPEEGVVTFTFDASDMLDRVVTEHPCIPMETEKVKAQAAEVCYTPLMTYITLELEGKPEALEAFKAENGEGYVDENGVLLWPYSTVDVFGGWVSSLNLVDGEGTPLFPDAYGCQGYGEDSAEFTYPYIEEVPEELWLAPMEGAIAQMDEAVRIK